VAVSALKSEAGASGDVRIGARTHLPPTLHALIAPKMAPAAGSGRQAGRRLLKTTDALPASFARS
jgi:hypothetical protein